MMKKEHLSTDTHPKSNEEKLDNQLRDSFPTSDPPSFSPGAVGAPKNRESGAAKRRREVTSVPKARKKSGRG